MFCSEILQDAMYSREDAVQPHKGVFVCVCVGGGGAESWKEIALSVSEGYCIILCDSVTMMK